MVLTASRLTYRGRELDTSSDKMGPLRDSSDVVDRPDQLRSRMEEDGYLFLPGLLNSEEVLEAGHEVLRRLAAKGLLKSAYPAEQGVARDNVESASAHDLAVENLTLDRVIYGARLMGFYERFLGGEPRHFDHTWLRAKSPGGDNAAHPHYDIVFMGRGTKKLYTAWTPLMDIPLEMGGLIVLEGSHRHQDVIDSYGQLDVDKYCTNYEDAPEIETGQKRWQDHVNSGEYSDDAFAVQDQLGGRWLTADYQAGDVLTFCMFLMHASMDNQTNRFRISSDSRYQLASDPVDERWVGEDPAGHGPRGKKGLIC